jgi:stage II sporulation protein M
MAKYRINKLKKKRNYFGLGWDYIRESKNYILFVSLLFFIFVFLALIFDAPEIIREAIQKLLKEIIETTKDKTGIEMIVHLFQNNLKVSFIGLVFGILFGIVPLILCVVNGYVLGYVLKFVADQEGIYYLWRIFPYGIFELPAVLISLGLGLKLGMGLFSRNPDKEIARRFKLSLKSFLTVLLLLLIAAIIEGTLISFLK